MNIRSVVIRIISDIRAVPPVAASIIILLIISLSLVTLSEIVPSLAFITNRPLFELFHDTRNLLAISIAIFATLRYNAGLGAVTIIVYFALQIPHSIVMFSSEGLPIFSNFITLIIGLLGIWLFGRLQTVEKKAKQEEEAGRKSSEKYLDLVNNIRLGIFRSTPGETGRFLEVNEAMAGITGYTHEELLEIDVSSLYVRPEERKLALAEYTTQNSKFTREQRFRTKDGAEIIVADTKTPVRDASGQIIYFDGVLEDITARKQAEEQARKTEERYRLAMDNLQTGCIIIGFDWRFLYVNDAAAKQVKMGKNEMLGKAVSEVFPGTENMVAYADIRSCMQTRFSHRMEEKTTFPDGSIAWFSLKIEPVQEGVFILFEDITDKKLAEEAYRESEQRYRNLVENTTVGVFRNTLSGEPLYANEALLKIDGFTSIEEFTAGNIAARYKNPAERERFLKMLKERGKIDNFEMGIISKTGEVKSVLISATLEDDIISGMMVDITERKQAEAALAESEKRYRNLVENAIIGVSRTNADGKIIYANDALGKMLGFASGKEMIGAEVVNLYKNPADRELLLRELAKTGHVTNMEAEMVSATGENKNILMNLSKEGDLIEGMLLDVTAHRKMVTELERASQEWQTTFDSISDMVSIHDKDFKLVRVNRTFADFYKIPPEKLIGLPCFSIVHQSSAPISVCPFQETMRTGQTTRIEHFEPTVQRHLEIATSPILDKENSVIGCVHVMRDVTEDKKREEQLMLTDRLASVGLLASGIAHEMNNPLTGVIGFSDLLLEKDIPPEIREDLLIINKEARRTAEVVRGLLTFSRKQSTKKEPTNIRELILEVLQLRAYDQNNHNIQVKTGFAPDLPPVVANAAQLQQVFINLIVNAEQAMFNANAKGTLNIIAKHENGKVTISFADDGPGISPENMRKLFTPFFTTKEVGKGTGLGLSISHGIITEHGGQIYAESNPGSGATFFIELPVSS